MLDYYYIMSKDIGVGPHLIGILERIDRDNYQFRYLIKSNKFPNIIVHLSDMDDTHKIYNTSETWHSIMRRVVPGKDSPQCISIEKEYGLKHEEYNAWDFLDCLYNFHTELMKKANRRLPFHDSYERIYFYKELPRRFFRYDK